jgi:GntR family transcriptional regulator/MocR family aminotransferase
VIASGFEQAGGFDLWDGAVPNQDLSCQISVVWEIFPRKVVAHNDHLQEYRYNHYRGGMKKVASGFSPVIAIDRKDAKPLHKQIYEGFRRAILGRNLRSGQKIPSTRSLATELRVSRIPVLTAYSQLLAEGYFESRAGSGTFVSLSLPDKLLSPDRLGAPQTKIVSGKRLASDRSDLVPHFKGAPWLFGWGAFSVGQLAFEQFPFQVWSRLVTRYTRKVRVSALHFSDPMGSEEFRATIAEYLRTARAMNCTAEQIMIVSGSQQALEIASRVLLDPGDSVWLEEPGYRLARQVFAMSGCRLVPVPVDKEGLNVAAGLERCRKARAAYVTPSHQFPLGVTMSAARRLQLLDWAQRSGSWIVEDDYDSEYRYDSMPIASLQGLDQNARVIYIGTFSKTLFPSLRMGYVVIPLDLVDRFVAVRHAMDVYPPHLYQSVLMDFIHEGHFARHIRRTRLIYHERRNILVASLRAELGSQVEILGVEGGMHLAVTLPKGFSDREIAERAARQKLWLWPLSPSYLGTSRRQGFILGFGSSPTGEIPKAVRQMQALMASN